jgi:pimeloyl-ACP methyl ester carboxylesterase
MRESRTPQYPLDSYLFLNGLRFHYRDWGGEGRPLVLLHGLASNARIWDFVAPRLAAHFRVLALDQRSHGLTDPAADGFDFPSIVRDLHAFVETLSLERPVLAGHSWGASTVLQYAVNRPAGPAGIVLVDGGVGELSAVPGMTWEKAEQILRPPDLDGMPREEFLERARGWMDSLYSEAAAILLANFEITADDTLRRRLPIVYHMQVARAIYEQKTSGLYARLRCPALLCPAIPPFPRDERSEQYLALKREGVARAEQASPLVRTVWFADTVHDVPLHRPAELAQAIVAFGSQIAD